MLSCCPGAQAGGVEDNMVNSNWNELDIFIATWIDPKSTILHGAKKKKAIYTTMPFT
jgi:hypothetical protein